MKLADLGSFVAFPLSFLLRREFAERGAKETTTTVFSIKKTHLASPPFLSTLGNPQKTTHKKNETRLRPPPRHPRAPSPPPAPSLAARPPEPSHPPLAACPPAARRRTPRAATRSHAHALARTHARPHTPRARPRTPRARPAHALARHAHPPTGDTRSHAALRAPVRSQLADFGLSLTVPYRSIPFHTVPYRSIPLHTASIPFHTVPYRYIPFHTVPYRYSSPTLGSRQPSPPTTRPRRAPTAGWRRR